MCLVFARVCSRRGGFATTVCRVRYNGGMPLYRDAFVPSDFGTAVSGTPLVRMPLYRATHCIAFYHILSYGITSSCHVVSRCVVSYRIVWSHRFGS